MKVLKIHLSDSHKGGGGGIAMYRLHTALRKAGVDSRILCRRKTINDSHIAELPRIPRIEPALHRVTSRLGLNDVHRLGSFQVTKHKFYRDADIIHFHGTHGGTLSYLAIPSLTRSKPAVFTLHDMWAMTGHCAVSYDCDRWKTGCGRCPYPNNHPSIRRDGTRTEWKLKDWSYSHSHLTIISPSTWMTEQAKQSMLNRFPIRQIPHGLDTEVYRPIDAHLSRSLLGLPLDKKIMLFASQQLKNPRKGGDLLLESLHRLPMPLKAEALLLTFGHYEGEKVSETAGIPTINLGYIKDDQEKATIYSAADFLISPTRQDNLPLIILESMACGTPTVAFAVGGVADLVRSGVTGYLAEPENSESLCEGIIQLLENDSLRDQMSEQCRAIVLNEFTLELYLQRHLELYQELLESLPQV